MRRSFQFRKLTTLGVLNLLLWGLLYLFLQQRSVVPGSVALLSFFYSFSIALILFLVQTLIIPKASIFPGAAQIFLKMILYVLAVVIGAMPVFILHVLRIWRPGFVINQLVVNFFQGLTALLVAPFSADGIRGLVSPQVQFALTSLLTMLFLIGLTALLGSYLDTRGREMKISQQMNDVRIRVLQARMEPHFLFNTLNTITAVVHKNPALAESLLIHLSEFLRYSFTILERQTTSLREEIQFTRHYLTLLKARFNGHVEWDIQSSPECGEISVPPLIVQPLVENSAKYGWTKKRRTLTIQIRCFRHSSQLIIEAKDDGAGFDLASYVKFPPPDHALDSIAQRLRYFFKEDSKLEISSQPKLGTTVRIKIPMRQSE